MSNNKAKTSAVTPGRSESIDDDKRVHLTVHIKNIEQTYTITTTENDARRLRKELNEQKVAVLAIEGWLTSEAGGKTAISWSFATESLAGVEITELDKI